MSPVDSRATAPAHSVRARNTPSSAGARYARLWDDYSEYWDNEPAFRKYPFLGDEWAQPEWTDFIIQTFVAPYTNDSSQIVEIGPGGGHYTSRLLNCGASVIGVDVSPRMLDRVRRRFAEEPRFAAFPGTGTDLSRLPDQSADFIFAFNVFIQLDLADFYSYLTDIGRVLKPGGHASLHYATITSDEGFQYFVANRAAWSAQPCQRGRFCEITMSMAGELAARAGLTIIKNQKAGRDAVMVLTHAGTITQSPSDPAQKYSHIDEYLTTLAADIYHEMPTDHHTAAARDTVDLYLSDLNIHDALELGCGTAPTLDRLREMGVATRGVTLGAEPCTHPVVRRDIQFSGLPPKCTDLVVARHILEHSVMPLLFLMEMHRLTRRYVLVVVPCDEEIWIRWPNHYSVFGKSQWRRLFERAGFRVVREGDGPLEPASTEWRFLLERTDAPATR